VSKRLFVHASAVRVRFAAVVTLFAFAYAATPTAQSPPSSQQDLDRVLLKNFLVEGGRPNLVEGVVERISNSNKVAPLKFNETLNNGDTIQSAASARAEILLIPGYYLRLDQNTRITLLDLSPDNMKLKLWSGSAILEVATNEMFVWTDFVEERKQLSYQPVSFLTPGAEYLVVAGGNYRFEVDGKGESVARVVKGVAFVNGSRIDNGMNASVDRGKLVVTSKSKPEDAFDKWSRQRAKSLINANHSLINSQWYKRVRSNRGYVLIKDPEDATRAKEKFTVSAETGVVVLVDHVLVSRASAPAWRKLKAGERLVNADRVRTETESRAEIHVYPNCFLFLEGDTELVYREAEGQVTVEVIKGSMIAILEPDPGTKEPAVLTVVVDNTEHRISEQGNYRINMIAGKKSELLVNEGRSRVPVSEVSLTKRNRASDKVQAEVMIKKLVGDSFDVWSYRRSRLPNIRSFGRYFGPMGGMWFLVESTGEYTFVPARLEYSSPYGGRYSIKFAEDTSLETKRPNPALEPQEPPFRPVRP
jgi:hypothetical protein